MHFLLKEKNVSTIFKLFYGNKVTNEGLYIYSDTDCLPFFINLLYWKLV